MLLDLRVHGGSRAQVGISPRSLVVPEDRPHLDPHVSSPQSTFRF